MDNAATSRSGHGVASVEGRRAQGRMAEGHQPSNVPSSSGTWSWRRSRRSTTVPNRSRGASDRGKPDPTVAGRRAAPSAANPTGRGAWIRTRDQSCIRRPLLPLSYSPVRADPTRRSPGFRNSGMGRDPRSERKRSARPRRPTPAGRSSPSSSSTAAARGGRAPTRKGTGVSSLPVPGSPPARSNSSGRSSQLGGRSALSTAFGGRNVPGAPYSRGNESWLSTRLSGCLP